MFKNFKKQQTEDVKEDVKQKFNDKMDEIISLEIDSIDVEDNLSVEHQLSYINALEEARAEFNGYSKEEPKEEVKPEKWYLNKGVLSLAGTVIATSGTIAAVLLSTAYAESDNFLSDTARKVVDKGIKGNRIDL